MIDNCQDCVGFIRPPKVLSECQYQSLLESRYKPAVTTQRERERDWQHSGVRILFTIAVVSGGVTIVPVVVPHTHTTPHQQPYR